MSLLPSWDSLEEIQLFSGRMTWLMVISGAILALAGIVQRIYDVRASTLQGGIDDGKETVLRQLRGDVRAAEERANAAEGRIAGIEKERLGLLTQEQWEKIASQKAPSRLMVAVGWDSSPKSQELANQLLGALEAGNWGVWRLPDLGVRSTGVIIGWSGGNAREEHESLAKRLREVLESAGVECEMMDSHETPLNAPLCLLIGKIE